MCARTYSVAACNRRNWIAAAIYNFAESTGTSPQFDNSELGRARERAESATGRRRILIEPFISEIGFYNRRARILGTRELRLDCVNSR